MDEFINLVFDKIVVTGNEGWFIDINYNILFRMDLETYIKEAVFSIPCYGSERYQYRRMVAYESKLVLIPYNSDRVIIYDRISGQIDEIKLEISLSPNNMKMCYADAIVKGNKVYMIPARYQAFSCIDMDTLGIQYFKNPVEEICKSDQFNKNRHIFHGNNACVQDRIVLPLWQECAFLYGYLDKMEFELKKIGNGDNGIHSVCCVDSKIYCSTWNQMLFYIVDCATWDEKEYSLEKQMNDSMLGAAEIFNYMDKLFIIPAKGASIYESDLDFMGVRPIYENKLEYATEVEKYAYADLSYTGGTMEEGRLYLYSQYDGEMLQIDCLTSEIRKIGMKYKKDEGISEQIKNMIKNGKEEIIRENEFMGLSDFLEAVSL